MAGELTSTKRGILLYQFCTFYSELLAELDVKYKFKEN